MNLPLAALIEATCAAVAAHADELTALDAAIGDGDHGTNLKRGFDAVLAEKDAIIALPPHEALHKAGMILVMKVGGASGPLYGSLLLGMAAGLKEGAAPAAVLGAGVAKLKARGKSDVGAKTMLDVLVPVQDALEGGAGPPQIRAAAEAARDATRAMIAKRGRASFLGERSKGHVDPGAASAALLIGAVCDALEGA